MEWINKRTLPQNSLALREEVSSKILALEPIRPQSVLEHGLEKGNKKTGISGRFYDAIYVWNLPAFTTCPGHTEWCRSNCYNADMRGDVYPHERWCENWWLFLNNQAELKKQICDTLQSSPGSKAVRIHSSGDFFSRDYCSFWEEIMHEFSEVDFWSYTRSWRILGLRRELYKMREIDNLHLYASIDNYTGADGMGLPKSRVFSQYSELKEFAEKSGGFICPEQFNLVSCCADCGFCMRNKEQDILFLLH